MAARHRFAPSLRCCSREHSAAACQARLAGQRRETGCRQRFQAQALRGEVDGTLRSSQVPFFPRLEEARRSRHGMGGTESWRASASAWHCELVRPARGDAGATRSRDRGRGRHEPAAKDAAAVRLHCTAALGQQANRTTWPCGLMD